jgi:exodeoxyribonuclease V alpha subunit
VSSSASPSATTKMGSVCSVLGPREHLDETTVVGSLPSVNAGEWLVAEDWWVRDNEHGLQFKATAMKAVPPTTVEGIERCLSSGLVKGIGPVLATKLVARFGAEVLEVIEARVTYFDSLGLPRLFAGR